MVAIMEKPLEYKFKLKPGICLALKGRKVKIKKGRIQDAASLIPVGNQIPILNEA